MAEEKQSSRDTSTSGNTSTSSTASTASTTSTTTSTTEKKLNVELLALSWQQMDENGKTLARHQRGAQVELPEYVVKSANSNGFKPAFRVLEDS